MSQQRPRGVFAALFLISTAIITLEIVWTRLLAITMYHHFAHMVIGVSMAGLGAAGALLVTPALQRRPAEWILRWSARLFGACALVGLPILARTTADPLGVLEGFFLRELIIGLTICHIVIFLSFLFAGLFICTCISRFGSQVSRLYAADLVGAATGCIVAVVGLLLVEGPDVVLVCVGLVGVAALLVSPDRKKEARLLVPLVAFLVFIGSSTRVEVQPSRRKEINFLRDEHQVDVAASYWHPLGHIEVLEEITAKPYIAGYVSPTYGPEEDVRVKQATIFNDGVFLTPIIHCGGDVRELSFIPYTLHSFPYQIRANPRVLVIGFGGGIDLYTSLFYGSRQTVGVEINPIIRQLLLNDYREYTGGVFDRANLETYTSEGRHFVSQLAPEERFDIIQLTVVDTFTALASGAYAVSENYLYTVEAFQDFVEHLTPNGILSFMRQEFSPPRENMRLCTIAVENARRGQGPDPRTHLVIVDSDNRTYAIFMLKKSPYTPEEVDRIHEHAELLQFKVLYDPFHRHDNEYGRCLQSPDPAEFARSYRYDVTPTTDDRPYFFQFSRLSGIFDWRARPDEFPPRSVPTAFLVVLVWSLEIVVLAFPLIWFPLRRQVREGTAPLRLGTLVYFSCLGIGFLAVELTMMQRLTLYLGNPVYAIVVVLFALLLFSGGGSHLSHRLRVESRHLGMVLSAVTVMLVVYAFSLGWFTNATLRFSFPARILLTFGLLGPLGILMGMPFPTGVRILNQSAPGLVPIAWGANAFASTLGAALSALSSVVLGFPAVLVGAGMLYLLALVAVPWLRSGFRRGRMGVETGPGGAQAG